MQLLQLRHLLLLLLLQRQVLRQLHPHRYQRQQLRLQLQLNLQLPLLLLPLQLRHLRQYALLHNRADCPDAINEQSILTLRDTGKVRLLLEADIEKIEDREGIPAVVFATGGHQTEEFDYVVFALGGSTPENFLRTIGIEFNGKEPVLNEGYETNVPGMFLIGDLSAGTKGGSIIWAFNSANTAMRKIIEKYL